MSTSTIALEARRATWLARLLDYVELTKPKIAILVLVTVAVSAAVASRSVPSGWLLASTLLGTALVAASASALNQLLERESDARMERTENRPLPAGRLSTRQVIAFAAVTIVLGTAWLAVMVRPETAAWGLATWVLYVWIYTPMKTRTTANTAIGAVSGALPVLIGFSSVGAALDLRAWSLFLIVYLWQFPHFMAIAWIYREQYAAAGLAMVSVVDRTGYRTAAMAVSGALFLIPTSFVPFLSLPGAELSIAWALLLGTAQFTAALLFAWQLSDAAARRLLFASLVYLPAMLGLFALGPLG